MNILTFVAVSFCRHLLTFRTNLQSHSSTLKMQFIVNIGLYPDYLYDDYLQVINK